MDSPSPNSSAGSAAAPPPAEDVTPMDMPAKRAAHLAIFLTVVIDLIGFGILIPILQPFALRFGASETQAAWLVGTYSLMQFIFSPILGVISDRVGRRPVIIASLIGSVIGYLIIAGAELTDGALAITLLFLARIITGIGGASFSTAQAYLADITAPEKRAGVMGMIGAAFGIGFVLGPVIGALTSNTRLGPSLPFFIAAAMSLANTLYCWRKLPETLPPERRGPPRARSSALTVMRRLGHTAFPAILTSNFLVITAFSIMTTTYILFAGAVLWPNDKDLVITQNGKVFGFIGLIAIVIQGGIIRRVAHPGNERTLALGGVLCMAVSMVLIPWTTPWLSLLGVMAVMSIGNSFATPTLNAMASRCGTLQTQGETMGAMSSAGSFGRFLGPFITGNILWFLPSHFDYAFWLAAVIMAVAGIMVLRIRSVAPPAA